MIVNGNRGALEPKGARIIVEALQQALERKPYAVLGVVGGSSVGGILSRLQATSLEWSRVHLFMADERLVPIDHPDSNFQLVSSYVEPSLPGINLHPYLPDGGDDQREALDAYQRELCDISAGFDVVLLSAGEDGHVASLFPGHETVCSGAPYFIATGSAPKPPPGRMSGSRALLSGSSVAILLFFGREKQAALHRYLDEATDVTDCPAKLVQAVEEHFVLTDCGVPES